MSTHTASVLHWKKRRAPLSISVRRLLQLGEVRRGGERGGWVVCGVVWCGVWVCHTM